MYGKGLRALSISTVAAMSLALGLVFFYAPLEAEQGFLQKIFYVHVPLAIVSLCGFVIGGILAIQHLRTRDSRWDMRSYVVIHMSLIFGVGDADHRLHLGQGLLGALVGLERADPRLVPDRLPALRDLSAAALRDRGPRAPVALRLRLRRHRRGLRADELHRRPSLDGLPPPAGPGQRLEPAGLDGVHLHGLAGGDRPAVRDALQVRADGQAHARAGTGAAPAPRAARRQAPRAARSAAPTRARR